MLSPDSAPASPEEAPSPPIVFGMGTWGYALATVLAAGTPQVLVWDRTPGRVAKLAAERRHDILDDVEAPAALRPLPGADRSAAIAREHVGSDALLVLGMPSFALRSFAEGLREAGVGGREEVFVIACKGLESGTYLTMPEVLTDVFGAAAERRIALLSGPSHAEEVVQRQPTTIVAASGDPDTARRVQAAFMTPRFRVYTQSDTRGVALGGALKNIYAIAAGVCAGLGFGDNTLAALMTRGLAEISRIGARMGAQPATFAGLAGLGDLIVTCISRHSRNRRFGTLRAEGRSTERALEEIGMVVEGVRTCEAAFALAQLHGVDAPIIQEIHALIYEDKPARDAIAELMTRDPKPEDTLASPR